MFPDWEFIPDLQREPITVGMMKRLSFEIETRVLPALIKRGTDMKRFVIEEPEFLTAYWHDG